MMSGVVASAVLAYLYQQNPTSAAQYMSTGFIVLALGFLSPLHHVKDGRKCLAFLRREGIYAAGPVPGLILMDLDMPGMDGRQALAEIVADDALKHLPVVILTSREERDEILRMYRLRCNSYIRKPSDFRDFVRKFAAYWLSVVMLPGDTAPARPRSGEGGDLA